jgi:hypothetical protein
MTWLRLDLFKEGLSSQAMNYPLKFQDLKYILHCMYDKDKNEMTFFYFHL